MDLLKVPLCYENEKLTGGVHYMNDICAKALDCAVNKFLPECPVSMSHLVGKNLIVDCGDCFSFAERHPGLVGKVDAIYIQNFEHFLSPKKHQNLLNVIFDLLAPGGKAFLSALTFSFGLNEKHLGFAPYQENKKLGIVYPSYLLEVTKTNTTKKNIFGNFYDVIYTDVKKIDQDLDLPIGYINKIEGLSHKYDNLSETYSNRFSPSVYKNPIKFFNDKNKSDFCLEVLDSYFISQNNEIVRKWTDELQFAAAVVVKEKK